MECLPVLCQEKKIEIPLRFFEKFGIFKGIVSDDNSLFEDWEAQELDCSPRSLELILQWLIYHENDTESYFNGVVIDENNEAHLEKITGWDKSFIESLDRREFYQFGLDALDLEVDGLSTMIYREMATRLSVPAEELAKSLQYEDIIDLLTENV